MAKKQNAHYVNNKEFSQAVVNHVAAVCKAREEETPIPRVPDYIGKCFLLIAEGLSHKANFIRYPYREEMVMDAVENCLRAIANYDITKSTRSGLPNAFGYFTQICYFAFIRRINKEKKQMDTKIAWLESMAIEEIIENNHDDPEMQSSGFLDFLRERISEVKRADAQFEKFAKEHKQEAVTQTPTIEVSSKGIEKFFGD